MGTKFKYIYLWTHIGLYGVAGSRAGVSFSVHQVGWSKSPLRFA